MSIEENTQSDDRIATTLRSYAQYILIAVFGLLPILFIPKITIPFEYSKVMIVVLGVLVALVLYSLSVLRSGVIPVGVSYPLMFLWVIAGFAGISSLLSGDFADSFIGDFFSIHGTLFVIVLALIPTIFLLLRPSKVSIMRLYVLLALSTLLLVFFHLARLFFGAETFIFNIFTNNTTSPVGGWNDLALFLGLTVILSLIALEQLSLTKVGRILFGVVTLAALFMLGVINFFLVWVVLGVTSLVIIVYALGKDRFGGSQLTLTGTRMSNTTSLVVALIVFVISVVFIIGGATFGGVIAQYTKVSFLEVRPSFSATIDIARNVYHENAFFGIGANKFVDAWRLYRDNGINQTLFWNTDFNAGNGYVTSFFVTTGVLGGLAWIAFLGTFLVTGVRRLLSTTNGDRMWYFIGVSSFVSAMYIWIMSIVYAPGVVILIMGALCTGIALSAIQVLSGVSSATLRVGSDRRTGFVLTIGVIVVIIVSVGTLYTLGRHYTSVYVFNEALKMAQDGGQLTDVEKKIEQAFALSKSDIYARKVAELEYSTMNSLIARSASSEADIQKFQQARELSIRAAQRAVEIDQFEPANWEILGNIFGLLAGIGLEGAGERAEEAFTKSQALNPKNPLPYLELAVVVARGGDFDRARSLINESIRIKPNFTDAFYLLSQLEIAVGNVEAAIQSTRSIITLEPQNAGRYYQLGVLELARKNLDGAISAFEQAITFDQNYANARYLLALAYDEKGRSAEAKTQLEIVQQLNPDNVDVRNLVQVITEDGSLGRLREGINQTVDEATPTTKTDGTVSTTQVTDSPLVTPVNTVPKGVEHNDTN